MLRFSEIVFGPIHSRRLGSSLGINVLPTQGKLCNFDCIYCECGWNADGRVSGAELPDAAAVAQALEAKLQDCSEKGINIDSITFSGNGEPTINPHFAEIVDVVVRLRDRFFPASLISVLSNATMLESEAVFAALRKIDNPILKIDGPWNEMVRAINKPAPGYDVERVIANLERFEGDFVLQTMFLLGAIGADGRPADLVEPAAAKAWVEIALRLHPRSVMVYTIDRETPDKSLRKVSVDLMKTITAPLSEAGIDVQISG